ncbi:receptor-type tyrosine-protein phosphatase-like N isoform X3 [Diachasma alloeum]|uniref:receptor-type tyrosine-protein phosphatase-like N isoform X3 n=1 Tax=Diachasma alloeum TaxID=454923 RepID=UPI000738469C|nr:receptor-type tyrosine-protein phosphatase-like N isoform X3 [Diachasma alloeum]
MGGKRWREGVNCLSIVLILLLEDSGVYGVGEIGCLFDKTLCRTLDETCYDAFGRCIQPYSLLDSSTAYRYDLDPSELELLRSVLEKLVAENYQWSHPYTQCVITSTLNSIRYETPSDDFTCDDLGYLPPPPNPDMRQIGLDPDDNGISPLAVVKFMPTRGHGYGDFANELYYPPPLPLAAETTQVNVDNDITDQRTKIHRMDRHPTLRLGEEGRTNFPDDSDESEEAYRYDEELYELSQRLQEQVRALRAAEETKMLRSRRHSQREALTFIDEPYDDEYPESFGRSDNIFRPKVVNTTFFDADGTDLEDFMKYFEANAGLRGGGREEKTDEDDEDDSTELDLGDYSEIPYWQIAVDLPGFKRPERLDVKKPGPFYSTNNYAFKMQTIAPDDEEEEVEGVRRNFVKKEFVAGGDITKIKDVDVDRVDVDHVFIKFDKEIRHWIDGEIITKSVAKLLGLEMNDLTETRVGRAEVIFTVMANKLKMNATQIVGSLSNIREDLEKIANMRMTEAGIGDKTQITLVKFPQVHTVESNSQNVIEIIACVVMGAVAAASIVLIIIVRRQSKTRRKLAGLATPDPEASKDYQELCRARMQAKVPTAPSEKPESPRIISLSKESESNRSSTSSWGGDDPAALTNMDIATGHMVLMYMEDHLKNKDRLDQEWAAICAYETDPSSIAIATDNENIDKNRPGSAFPYDHSRIVLNDLSNLNSSDYINASTITPTDHDPRNPAYIATQGPLPQTSADFWQLVWEQGSVVIVMLTRLTEEGQAMCHRYWPEEGSELYHIYEVHLVSEHIWCDDYLVRSFYLKNLRTGETRTVTQFHFLSWPENGVPQSTKALLEFRRKVNKSYRGRSCPIVVHCSDGAGRTGTYCLIDMVLNRMAKGAKEIDIAAALEHIRDQRPGMVSTKQQFEFVLVAVAEEVHAILKALPVPPTDKTQNTPPSSSSGSDK